ncbi:MAG: Asp-tRNA(Asn)/Glu-tRNA(Gln) amidotransferase subunit GatC [Clostridiales bacterium]|nr:Asp-tRNA(Asn)/Glu-tRNA(Gln) amidotransferase subunit GatC [Clostridiales bacterium]
MDIKTISNLAELSQLDFNEEEVEKLSKELDTMVGMMGKIKQSDAKYECSANASSVDLDGLRADEAKPSMPTDELLANAQSADGYFVVPKVME